MTRTRDTFDMFSPPDRGRFGDNESIRGNDSVRSNLCDLDLILHNDNPQKKAIAVSLAKDTPFARWAWLPRSMIEYEKTGIGRDGGALVRVTLPETLAKQKGLI
jgi:hypothetical protein